MRYLGEAKILICSNSIILAKMTVVTSIGKLFPVQENQFIYLTLHFI